MKPSNPFSSLLRAGAGVQPEKRNRFLALVSFVLALLLLYPIVRDLDWPKFLDILLHARYALLPVVFVWGSLAYLVHAARWRLLVQSEKPVRLADVFFANMVGFLGNILLPAQAGSLARSAYLLQMTGASASFSIATQIVQRIMDTVALIIVGSLALAASGAAAPVLQQALVLMSAVGAGGLLFLLLLPRFGGRLEKIIAWLPIPGDREGKLKPRLVGMLHKFLDGIKSLQDARRAVIFGGLTLLIRLMDGMGAMLSAYVLNFSLTLPQGLVLLAGWGLSSFIPLTPGDGLVIQFVTTLVFAIFAISKEYAVAMAVYVQVAGLVMVSIWSLVGLLRVPYKPPTNH